MFGKAPPNFELLLSQFHSLNPGAETKNLNLLQLFSVCFRLQGSKSNLVSWTAGKYCFPQTLSTIISLIGLRLIEGQCLHLSNLSSLEVEDIHCVHFNIIDVDFGIRAVVNLGKKRRIVQSWRVL